METWAIVVAGGTGTRFGGPKQFAELEGKPVLAWSLEAARRACAGLVAVLPEGDIDSFRWDADVLVPGGSTRSGSVRAGLTAVPESAQVIVVHDAARPLATAELWKAVISEVTAGAEGAVPACPVSDTIRQRTAEGGTVTLDRSNLFAVQTPQAFRAAILRRAHDRGGDATDDSAMVEAIGGRITLVDGSADNLKVTTPSDLRIASLLARSGR
ncbi:MAG TPA: 2-C-methyl-D-erythritol 4-phosphate cytidylyltransferase [Acidimicrobiales bacterium]|nr:2-C-methyl-D-erythritol 4-phosphate cytidylyltransferase [Acidimicrobiales bacterium]